MAYDADSLIQFQREMRLRQKHAGAMRPAHEQIIARIEMLVGAWYVDQVGNQTREIKARELAGATPIHSKQKRRPTTGDA
jgi:hypothetical protein